MGPEELGPVVACIGMFAVPIVAILTSHQRKMATIIHGSQQNQLQNNAQQDQLASEVRDLKQIVYQQAIAIDSLTNEVRRSNGQPASQESLSSRLGQDPSRT